MKSIAEMEKLIENFDKFSYYLNDIYPPKIPC